MAKKDKKQEASVAAPSVEELTYQAPTTFKEFLAAHRKQLKGISFDVGTPGFWDVVRMWNTIAIMTPERAVDIVQLHSVDINSDLVISPNPHRAENFKRAAEARRVVDEERARQEAEEAERQAKMREENARRAPEPAPEPESEQPQASGDEGRSPLDDVPVVDQPVLRPPVPGVGAGARATEEVVLP